MNLPKTEQETSALVNPFNIFKPEWEVNRKSVQVDSLIAKHDVESPDEVIVPPITHHMMLIQLSHGSEQLTHIGNEKYEGAFNSGEFFLHPANHSAFYSWKSTDETIVFIIEPTYLRRLAEETECFDPNRIELLPIVCDRDLCIMMD